MLQILFRIYHRVFSGTMRKFKLLYQEYGQNESNDLKES